MNKQDERLTKEMLILGRYNHKGVPIISLANKFEMKWFWVFDGEWRASGLDFSSLSSPPKTFFEAKALFEIESRGSLLMAPLGSVYDAIDFLSNHAKTK